MIVTQIKRMHQTLVNLSFCRPKYTNKDHVCCFDKLNIALINLTMNMSELNITFQMISNLLGYEYMLYIGIIIITCKIALASVDSIYVSH